MRLSVRSDVRSRLRLRRPVRRFRQSEAVQEHGVHRYLCPRPICARDSLMRACHSQFGRRNKAVPGAAPKIPSPVPSPGSERPRPVGSTTSVMKPLRPSSPTICPSEELKQKRCGPALCLSNSWTAWTERDLVRRRNFFDEVDRMSLETDQMLGAPKDAPAATSAPSVRHARILRHARQQPCVDERICIGCRAGGLADRGRHPYTEERGRSSRSDRREPSPHVTAPAAWSVDDGSHAAKRHC